MAQRDVGATGESFAQNLAESAGIVVNRSDPDKHGWDQLWELQRPGHAKALSDKQEAQIIAMVCSAPPDGHARWTTELVVEQAIARGVVDKVGRETIRVLLRHHDLKPWREKKWVRQKNLWATGGSGSTPRAW